MFNLLFYQRFSFKIQKREKVKYRKLITYSNIHAPEHYN